MQSLFPTSAANQGGSSPLLQFPAGKCILTALPSGKFTVTADPRRGFISISKGNDGLVHFKWSNQISGTPEDDRMVFPGENVFKRVKTGVETDRVYMLQYITGNQRLMYWMQEKTDANDEKNVKQINDLINNNGVSGGAPAPGATTTVGPDEWRQLIGGSAAPAPGGFNGLDLSSLLGGAARPPVPPAQTQTAAPVAAAPAPVTIEDLQRAMFSSSQQARAQPAAQQQQQTPPLQDIVLAEDVVSSGIFEDPALVAELLSHLPEEQRSVEHLNSTVRSAQFQQALGSLTSAVQHPDNYQSVVSNFGINPEAGTAQLVRGDGVGAFLTALQASNPVVPGAVTATTTDVAEEKQEEKNDGDAPMDQE